MIQKLRIILDTEDDVFRDIEIDANDTLLTLSDAINNSFLMEGEEMSAFYISDDQWNQGEEILPKIMQEENDNDLPQYSVEETLVSELLSKKSKRLLYVYDFMNMWTFFIELMEEREGSLDYPITVFEYGVKPKDPSAKAINFMESDDENQWAIDEDIDDDDIFNEDFESLDEDEYDQDFEQY